MPKKFTLLIDESGDQGLDRVMTRDNPFGASSYLTMGAALVPTADLVEIRSKLEAVRIKLDVKALHCTDLSHSHVSFLAKELTNLRMLAFGVISKKTTLGDYKNAIDGETRAHDYYNKCCQYLFELVGQYAGLKEIPSSEIDVIFEEKRGHDYSRLARFLKAIADKPIDSRAAKLNNLMPIQIGAKSKGDEPALSIADLVAYALHKSFCAENNRLNLTEQRYLRELKPKFCRCDETQMIANFGIKFIKGPVEMGLQGVEYRFAMKFYSKISTLN